MLRSRVITTGSALNPKRLFLVFGRMECVAARNFAAMAVSFGTSSRLRKKKPVRRGTSFSGHGYWYGSRCLRVKARARSESLVAVDENFADEENYIKAGGSELVFVQMQQKKSMEKQSKLADKV